jgi:hypothetical protein
MPPFMTIQTSSKQAIGESANSQELEALKTVMASSLKVSSPMSPVPQFVSTKNL